MWPFARFGQRVFDQANHVDLSAVVPRHSSSDADGYPLAGLDEVPTTKRSSAHAE